jgi:hypothetical protein
MCTDAEAASETDETRYVNAKQKKMAVDNIIATISMATASGTQTISHSL